MGTEEHTEEVIFDAAIGFESPLERLEYVEKACGGDKELQARVEGLLEVYEKDQSFLESAAQSIGHTLTDFPMMERPGQLVGRYKLLEKIGEGGMAVVYMAEQREPIRRQVAVKVIKLGMDTKQVVARFEAERQALAMMDHPNIAKVLDAGATEAGRPYFVMELVRGVSITEYCDKNKLDTDERLDLFVRVCHAVRHAHQKGIIHRDIKPSNIMVTLHDGVPVPKIIDFGIAKAMRQRLTERTLFTRYAQMIGTPEYMSPEQAEMSGLGIDERTDIYSLGVLLYELLTGTTPFKAEELRQASYNEICRIIREIEPPRPSTRLSTLGDTLTEIARDRHLDPGQLRKSVRGDLDWIVMRCLEKDRTRRYDTPEDLAADVRRHLDNQPVLAGAPGIVYRLQKFTRRNRIAVIVAGLVMCASLTGATVVRYAFWPTPGSMGTEQHASGMVMRHVWDLPAGATLSGTISRDGRYVSYVDWNAGNVAAYDVLDAQNWLVTDNTDSTWETIDGWAESSAISPDGKQIAYSWYNEKGIDFYDLRVVNMDGTNMRILHHDPNTFWINVHDWSPDGKDVLAYFSDAEKTLTNEVTGEKYRIGHLVLASVKGGSVRRLRTWHELSNVGKAAFSPDGRFIAFDYQPYEDKEQQDIYMLEVATGDETIIVDHPSDDRLLAWTPDGTRLLFASDRTADHGLWTIPVAGGVAIGPAELLKDGFNGGAVGFAEDGSYYYGASTRASNVLMASLGPAGTTFAGPPSLVSSMFVGRTALGDWSPDGKQLAYRTRISGVAGGDMTQGTWAFVLYSTETGQEKIITPEPAFSESGRMSGPWWSPDGRMLLVRGNNQATGNGLHTVDVETGSVETIANGRLIHAVWSPDSSSLYVRALYEIFKLDLKTGERTVIHDFGSQWSASPFDISPDGQWLVFYQKLYSLAVMPTAGGEPREIVRWSGDMYPMSSANLLTWLRDGEHVLCTDRSNQILKVNVETGMQQKIGMPIENLFDGEIHPSGNQIALTVQDPGSELWVLENFLPAQQGD